MPLSSNSLSSINQSIKPDGVLVLGATNVPWSLDPAVRRRFERRVYVPLPDAPSLRTLLRIHLGNAEHSLGESALNELSKQMGGLSGADVSVLVRDALLEPVRDLQRATHFRKAADGRWEACAPNVRGATKMGLMQVRQPSPTHTRGLPPSTPALLPLSSPTFPLPTPTSP